MSSGQGGRRSLATLVEPRQPECVRQLRTLREEMKLTQLQLAKALSVPVNTLRIWDSGLRKTLDPYRPLRSGSSFDQSAALWTTSPQPRPSVHHTKAQFQNYWTKASTRSDLKPTRTSSEKSCGCSQAAKCPPLSTLL